MALQLEHWVTNEAIPELRDDLLGVSEGGLHFVIDIWTIRLRQTILGIRVSLHQRLQSTALHAVVQTRAGGTPERTFGKPSSLSWSREA